MHLQRLLQVAFVLWIGSLFTIGVIVAPILFATLPDRVLAGTLAGRFFYIEAWLSLGFGLFYTAYFWRVQPSVSRYPRYTDYACLMIAILAALQLFGLQPAIVALREQAAALGGSVAQAPEALRQQFGVLHGASTLIYLLQLGLGLSLLWRTHFIRLNP
ncbi:DUF4149 domain-containing protein [Parvibium lacunae]|uniref:DUF4149 domain-containing protein n=1 Tax=Parvibium lacunae TaxID=1888893 RepID=A0A368L858_9BURK|nr:DUF4149 domain-containing protein [Parvibium lacunae]